jgi:hypothetical protein
LLLFVQQKRNGTPEQHENIKFAHACGAAPQEVSPWKIFLRRAILFQRGNFKTDREGQTHSLAHRTFGSVLPTVAAPPTTAKR